ncbi:MAG: DUF4290 domain-containing protein [Bacteroidota bacterium]
MHNYNSIRPGLILKEYGRNIQNLVTHVKSIEDRTERTAKATALVELMKQINPVFKDNPEQDQKVWDDLFIICGFELDIDSPYPAPEKEVLEKKPDRLAYTQNNLTFKHYGRNLELLIDEARKIEDKENRENAVIYLGRLMRGFHNTWSREMPDESVILKNMKRLSDNELDIDLEKVKENNLFEPFHKERKSNNYNNNKGGKRNFKKRRN